MGQIYPWWLWATPIEIISSCTCVTEEIIWPDVLLSPCVFTLVQHRGWATQGNILCYLEWVIFRHTVFMSTWWKENVNVRTSHISSHSFSCPAGSWQHWFCEQLLLLSIVTTRILPAFFPLPTPGRPCFIYSDWQCQVLVPILDNSPGKAFVFNQTNVQCTCGQNHLPEDFFTECPRQASGGIHCSFNKQQTFF